ncbi:MAG: methyl-accepting chemotaxis protein [Candidatus Omnitrophica bacterium]|nr:methyl-accepting chemotaxis protein [Candidatus Omnitrophota bacterium]
MPAVKYRRKNYLILLKFQAKYIFYILFFLYIGAAVAGYTVYWTTWVTLGEKLANVYPRGRLIYIFHAANMTLLLRIALLTPVFIIIGILLSHRIAGPIYRLGLYVEALKKNDFSRPLTLRKNDELQGLAKKMTELCDCMREKKEARDKIIQEIKSSVDKSGASPEHVKDISEKLEKVKIS